MSSDNVIHLAARRDSEAIGHASGRNAERDRTRWNEADALLQKLRETKRLKKADQATLVDNIGRLILQFDAANAKAIGKSILHECEWDKRKRYVRFPGEAVGRTTRQAASGGTFAHIVERLIDLFVARNVDRNQAKTDIVRKALQKTSLRPPSSFRMTESADEADAARLVADMRRVCDKLADEADLAEFFGLVSKHPNHAHDCGRVTEAVLPRAGLW
jgi:hypothetical protein